MKLIYLYLISLTLFISFLPSKYFNTFHILYISYIFPLQIHANIFYTFDIFFLMDIFNAFDILSYMKTFFMILISFLSTKFLSDKLSYTYIYFNIFIYISTYIDMLIVGCIKMFCININIKMSIFSLDVNFKIAKI